MNSIIQAATSSQVIICRTNGCHVRTRFVWIYDLEAFLDRHGYPWLSVSNRGFNAPVKAIRQQAEILHCRKKTGLVGISRRYWTLVDSKSIQRFELNRLRIRLVVVNMKRWRITSTNDAVINITSFIDLSIIIKLPCFHCLHYSVRWLSSSQVGRHLSFVHKLIFEFVWRWTFRILGLPIFHKNEIRYSFCQIQKSSPWLSWWFWQSKKRLMFVSEPLCGNPCSTSYCILFIRHISTIKPTVLIGLGSTRLCIPHIKCKNEQAEN